MHTTKRFFLGMMILSLILTSFTVLFAQDDEQHDDEENAHWTYEGEEGPDFWGSLDDDYATCAEGDAQSPINITEFVEVNLTNITFDYHTVPLAIYNNGHTIEVDVEAGSSITYNEITYDLIQFHFHNPSEHTVNDEAGAMEVHFVHREPVSKMLAVVSVIFTLGEEDNLVYAPIFADLPPEKSTPQPTDITINLNDLLPEERTFLTYQGSLTTPPCSEIVRWLILGTPLSLSSAQVEAFGAIFPMNARPTQDQNQRDLLVDVTP
jgi:carbonic anhydrase